MRHSCNKIISLACFLQMFDKNRSQARICRSARELFSNFQTCIAEVVCQRQSGTPQNQRSVSFLREPFYCPDAFAMPGQFHKGFCCVSKMPTMGNWWMISCPLRPKSSCVPAAPLTAYPMSGQFFAEQNVNSVCAWFVASYTRHTS